MKPMPIFTTESVTKEVPKRWRQQYPENSGDKYVIWKNLRAEKNLTAKKCEKIIGNSSWTRISCDQCKKEVSWAIQLGDEPDYESRTVLICKECLGEAIKTIKESEEG